MRIRSIKPEFWADEQVAGWPPHSRLAYIALWNEADDEGRLRASAAYLKSRLFPYEPTLDMEAVLKPIIEAGKLVLFEHAGQRYGFLPTFHQHQVINRPTKSKLPKPIVSTHGTLTDDSVSTHGVLTSGTGNRELGKEQGTGNKEKEVGAHGSSPSVELPLETAFPQNLNTDAFKASWGDWIAYRRERRLTVYKPRSVEAQLKALSLIGHDAAIACINNSIRQNWQGLFPEKFTTSGGQPIKGGHPFQTKALTDDDHSKGF